MTSTQTNDLDQQAMLDYAKQAILKTYSGYAYPDAPTDEWGNVQPFEPGCVDWIACEEIVVKDAFIDEDEPGCVIVRCDWEWTGQDPETDVELSIGVYFEDGKFDHGEIERVN